MKLLFHYVPQTGAFSFSDSLIEKISEFENLHADVKTNRTKRDKLIADFFGRIPPFILYTAWTKKLIQERSLPFDFEKIRAEIKLALEDSIEVANEIAEKCFDELESRVHANEITNPAKTKGLPAIWQKKIKSLNDIGDNDVFTISQAAECLGKHRDTIVNWYEIGKAGRKLNAPMQGRLRKIRGLDLKKFLDEIGFFQ